MQAKPEVRLTNGELIAILAIIEYVQTHPHKPALSHAASLETAKVKLEAEFKLRI